jgi:hypothetical protein
MTAIILNLLAEEQRAQHERARDPFKLFIAGGIGLVALAVGIGGVLSVLAGQKRTELQALESRWDQLDNAGSVAGEFQKIKSLADEILAVNRSRILFAPQLAIAKDILPATIQLARLDFSVSEEALSAPPRDDSKPGGKHSARPTHVERLVLRMEGKATSGRPELEVDKFLQTLRSDAEFGGFVEDIQLRSIARTSVEADRSSGAVPTANFVIECRYKAKESK